MHDDTDFAAPEADTKKAPTIKSVPTAHPDQNTVVQLEQKKPDYRFPEITKLEAYWAALRKGRLVPKRADVNPRGIESCLEYAFIAEEVAPGLARFRIAGMHLSELMGMDVRGMPVSSFFKANARTQLRDALKAAFEGPAIVKLDLTARGSFGNPHITGKLILLPLADETGAVTRVLGALVTIGPIGRGPRTFEILNSEVTPLEGHIQIDTLPHRTVEATAPKAQPKGKATRVPYLRVLDFDN
ncbi:PAS domain-containing protein [Algirhabdus cladophorae]|uniref:PAS domain-containing protein n=1 Tax=Algirhabdus cladophorae TaxID=3377108 RepID=UPI003B84A759